jgi:uncharacterized protein YndB with AHSA1/START domain
VTTDATVSSESGRTSVRLERRLVDPPPVVWRTLTHREELRSWFPCDVIVDGGQWVVGAAISFPVPPEVMDMTLSGEVLNVEEPTRLSFRWGDEILRFELSDVDSATLLVLHNELPPAFAARNAAGWDDCLDRLMGLTVRPNAWREHFAQYQRDFEPILGPQEGPPTEYKGTT